MMQVVDGNYSKTSDALDAMRTHMGTLQGVHDGRDWNAMDATHRDAMQAVVGAVVAVHGRVEAAKRSGTLTPLGLLEAAKPHIDKARSVIEKEASAVAAHRQRLEAARTAIATGRRVRTADGGFSDLPPREPSARDEIRHDAIRRNLAALASGDRLDVVRKALAADDQELIAAVEGAPRAFPAVDDATLGLIRNQRLERSGWLPTFERESFALEQRARLADKAAAALQF